MNDEKSDSSFRDQDHGSADGKSLREIAGHLGVSQTTVKRYKNGEVNI